MNKWLYVFLCSMLPVFELRGSIILARGLSLEPWWLVYLIAVIGNFIPIPFILLFIRKILEWMKTIKHLDKIALWLENKAHKNSKKVLKFASLGLFLFVAIPIPGTGAWMGALIAALMDMRMKYSLPSLFFGMLVAGIIMVSACYGLVSFLSFLV